MDAWPCIAGVRAGSAAIASIMIIAWQPTPFIMVLDPGPDYHGHALSIHMHAMIMTIARAYFVAL
jgi:hypothetical protein